VGADRVATAPKAGGPGATDVGVSAQSIKIGFIVVENNDKVESAYGVKGASFGSSRDQIDAVVGDLNSRGGVLGRKIDPVYRTYDSVSQASDETQYASICAGFTQDNHVFAVLAPWNAPTSFPSCLFKAHTLYLTDALLQEDAETFSQLSPFMYSGLLSLSRGAKAIAHDLHDQGFFAGSTKTGLIRFDYPSYQRASDRYLKPTLAALGDKVADEFAVRRGDTTQQLADVNAAVLRFASENINRVIFLTAAGGTALFFMAQAESQNYHPRYGLASPDAPAVLAQNLPSSQLAGAVGAGWMPSTDVLDAQGPPRTAAENRCLAIHEKHGTKYATRSDATTAFAFCDLMWLFEDAAVRAGADLTRARWSSALGGVGRSHTTPFTFATNFGPDHGDGATDYRPLAYDTGCQCFSYVGSARSVS
jgi:ABC-type branched-subunit amino acid transport system substrate-binding protein